MSQTTTKPDVDPLNEVGPRGLTRRGEALLADFLARYPTAREDYALALVPPRLTWELYQARLAEINAQADDTPEMWAEYDRLVNEDRAARGLDPLPPDVWTGDLNGHAAGRD